VKYEKRPVPVIYSKIRIITAGKLFFPGRAKAPSESIGDFCFVTVPSGQTANKLKGFRGH